MGAREEVQNIMDRRINELKVMTDHFDKYGNFQDSNKVIQHAINIALLRHLKDVKNQLKYTVDWGKNND